LQRAQDDFFRESEESEEGSKSRRSEEVGEARSSLARATSDEPVKKNADKLDHAGIADAHNNYTGTSDLDCISTTGSIDDRSGSTSTGTHSTNSIVRASTDTFDTDIKKSKQPTPTARESRRQTAPIVRGATGGNGFGGSNDYGNGHQKSQSNSQRMWRRGAEITVKPAFGDAG
jgi:hypothetical protein